MNNNNTIDLLNQVKINLNNLYDEIDKINNEILEKESKINELKDIKRNQLINLIDHQLDDNNNTQVINRYNNNDNVNILTSGKSVLIPPPKNVQRKAKIICAIGPSSRDIETLILLLKAGMNVARLNFSHGTHEYHLESLTNLRKAIQIIKEKDNIDLHCAVLMDTKGPEIRTGYLKDKKPIKVERHSIIEITTDYNYLGDNKKIACSYKDLPESVKQGDKILIADGELVLHVQSCHPEKQIVVCKADNTAIIEEFKNVNLPGVSVKLPGISEQDRHDIVNFGLKHNVDIISGSFVRSRDNVLALKKCLGENKNNIRVHAKIESIEALRNLNEIVQVADGIHVSRGDLGMELQLEKLPVVQKAIIHLANIYGKPVVTSTQMLHSMTSKIRPTNSECTDVANAILDGTDCVMLSAETAKGKYPVEAVKQMVKIIIQAERCIDFESNFVNFTDEIHSAGVILSDKENLALSAVETSIDINAPLIIVLSDNGQLALLVCKYRPRSKVLVVTSNPVTARQMSVSSNAEALLIDSLEHGIDVVWSFKKDVNSSVVDSNKLQNDHVAIEYALKNRLIYKGDRVVLVDGIEVENNIDISKQVETGSKRFNAVRVVQIE